MSDPIVPMAVDAESTAAPTPLLTEELKNSLDKVDLLVADLGQLGEFTRKAEKYVEEAATELYWNRVARAAAVLATLLIIIVLLMFLRTALDSRYSDAFTNNPYALSVLVGAVVGGVVILCITLTRSVHATFAERNAGMPMPEQLKVVIDAVKTILPHS